MSDDKKKSAPIKKDENSIVKKKPTNIDDHVMIPDDTSDAVDEYKKFRSDYASIKKIAETDITKETKMAVLSDFFTKNKKMAFTLIGLNPRTELSTLKTVDGMLTMLDIANSLANKHIAGNATEK